MVSVTRRTGGAVGTTRCWVLRLATEGAIMGTVQAVRQVRADWLIEVRVDGVWHLAYTLSFPCRTHTMGGEVRVGDLVRVG